MTEIESVIVECKNMGIEDTVGIALVNGMLIIESHESILTQYMIDRIANNEIPFLEVIRANKSSYAVHDSLSSKLSLCSLEELKVFVTGWVSDQYE